MKRETNWQRKSSEGAERDSWSYSYYNFSLHCWFTIPCVHCLFSSLHSVFIILFIDYIILNNTVCSRICVFTITNVYFTVNWINLIFNILYYSISYTVWWYFVVTIFSFNLTVCSPFYIIKKMWLHYIVCPLLHVVTIYYIHHTVSLIYCVFFIPIGTILCKLYIYIYFFFFFTRICANWSILCTVQCTVFYTVLRTL